MLRTPLPASAHLDPARLSADVEPQPLLATGVPEVLLITPDPWLRAMADELREVGIGARNVSSAAEALHLLDTSPAAAVVLDGELHPSDGAPLYDALQSLPSLPALLLVPGSDAVRMLSEAPHRDLDEFAARPLGVQELALRIKALLVRAGYALPEPEPRVVEVPVEVPVRMASEPLPAPVPPTVPITISYAGHPEALERERPTRELLGNALRAVARRWWVAALVLVSVMAADVYYTTTQRPTYLARATLVVSPSRNIERGQMVYSVDSLGRGAVLGTFAQVLGSDVVFRGALEQLGIPADRLNNGFKFSASTVGDSAVMQVSVEGPNPEVSANAANAAGEIGIQRMAEWYPLYDLVFLTRAVPPTGPARPEPMRNYSLGLLLGLSLGLSLAYLTDLAFRRARRPGWLRHQARPVASSAANGAESAAPHLAASATGDEVTAPAPALATA